MLEGLLEDVRQDIETLRVHPDLLFTMQLLARIESKKPEPNLSFVQEIHQTVWDGRKSKLGPRHALSLVSEFELAATYRELGDLEKAQATFERVVKERAKLLGTEHPDTLAARHEFLVMEYTLGRKIDITALEKILKSREWQLGRCHPDSLQSLLWIFGIQLLLEKETEAFATADKLLGRLREECVRNQRLVESLQTAEKVALFYEDQGYHQRSAEIFRNIFETIKDAEANADKSLDLASLQISAAKYLDSVKGKAVQA
jgi:tetratricopeptide (TPR) repeat protein